MVYPNIIRGLTVDLRPVEESDAAFILDIRADETVKRYVHALDISVEQQQAWIRTHRKMPGDYYFIIMDKAGKSLGTIGLYGLADGCGELGRLVCMNGPIESTEASMLVLDLAFGEMRCNYLTGSVVCENTKVRSMFHRFGFIHETVPKDNGGYRVFYGALQKAGYERCRPKIAALIKKSAALLQE